MAIPDGNSSARPRLSAKRWQWRQVPAGSSSRGPAPRMCFCSRPQARPRPFQGRALPSNALGLAHAHARGSASWERGLRGDWWAVTQRLGQRGQGGQRRALRSALVARATSLGLSPGPHWAEDVARAGLLCWLAVPAPL